MKRIFLVTILALAFVACNKNPSKEARIRTLETAIQQATEKISTLETSIQALEKTNEELKSRILELEK